jgi:hypothetical protein
LRPLLAAFAAAAVALLALPLPGHAQQADVTWYLHRDFSLDTAPPNSSADATFTWSLLPPHNVTFTSAPLVYNWTVSTPATFHLTLAPPQLTVLGRLQATLLVNGTAVGSTDEDILLDLREKDVALSFQELPDLVPAGSVVSLDVALQPFLDVGTPSPVGLSLVDLQVQMLYDSTAHPSGLRTLGNDPTARGAPGPAGPPGAPGSDGGPGGNGTDAGEPLNRTSGGLIPPVVLEAGPPGSDALLLGVGTSAIAVVAGLMLRGRSGLG